jgi:flagellar motility protein MotE (MotC chaperone)
MYVPYCASLESTTFVLLIALQKKILTLTKEIDFAVERHKALEQEKKQEYQRKLDSKLKRKGHLLLQPK